MTMRRGWHHPEITGFQLVVREVAVLAPRQQDRPRPRVTESRALHPCSCFPSLKGKHCCQKDKSSVCSHFMTGWGEFILDFYRVERVPMIKCSFDLVLMGFFYLAGRSKQMHKILVISLGKKNRYLLCHSHLRRGRGRRVGPEPAFSMTKEK